MAHGPPPTAVGWLTTPRVSAAASPPPRAILFCSKVGWPWRTPRLSAPPRVPLRTHQLGAKSGPSGPCPYFCLPSLLEGLRVQKNS